MNIISFDSFYNYFSNNITALSTDLYNNGEIGENLQFKFFPSTGEYINEVDNLDYDTEHSRDILVNILNSGGVQDTSVSIDAYIQTVSFVIWALDEQRDDITYLFTKFVANNKSVVTTLVYKEGIYNTNGERIAEFDKTATVNILADKLPVFSERFHSKGHDTFTTTIMIDIAVFPAAQLSNQYKLTINDNQSNPIEIKYNQLSISRTSEMMSDLRKREESKFFTNTTGFVVNVDGLFVSDNPILEDILTNCAANTSFDKVYTLQITRPDGTTLFVDGNNLFKVKDSAFTFKFGTVINWSVEFYPSVVI